MSRPPSAAALHGAEHAGAGGGPGQTDVQAGPEGAGSLVLVLDAEEFTVDLLLSLVGLVQAELVEDSPGEEETGAVGGGVVGEPDLDAIPVISELVIDYR